MAKELAPKYNHLEVESNKYNNWVQKGYFQAGDQSKKPFTIVIPPPNVTGKLHLGHAWDVTLQDIIIRYKRMQGFDALWLPGMDHAGIATQAKVDEKLRGMGINRHEIGREKFLEYAWSWKDEYASIIREQWAKMGLSLDYSRERFTLDQGLNDAVNRVFITLYEQGLIYRGERIINWDPLAKTALSNIEVIHKEVEGAFYHFKYMVEGTNEFLEVATTRPETMFGDVAVMVHPEDSRYTHLVGRNVLIPGNKKPIPVIKDSYVDKEFGTGAVKVTPAHDPNDFEVGNRHQLERIICMHPDGTMNELTGKYNGMDRFECRKQLVADLENEGLVVKIEKHVHSVGHSERTDVIVEPYLSKQWFVKMDELAVRSLENQQTEGKVNFVPDRFEKIFSNWMEDIQDWCISRQLWWGHRIPAWYKGEEVHVGYDAPTGDGWVQDEDVLDTWFSSALWPFSTLGWPDATNEDFNRYFPTDCLVTGYDIIFFWVSRMIFQSIHFTNQRPFKDVLIHGLIRAEDGRKMSKSLGNGVDPMDVIEKYGADSLRYFITTNSAPGQDLRYVEEKVESTWNFINKIWNASRFVKMNTTDFKYEDLTFENLSVTDSWILTRLNETIEQINYYMDKYEFGEVGRLIYNFAWNDFCDWYIELSKLPLYGTDEDKKQTTRSVLVYTLTNILKLMHPFMPYVTDEIFNTLPTNEESIIISSWPTVNDSFTNSEAVEATHLLMEIIKNVRNIRAEVDCPMSRQVRIYLKAKDEQVKNLLEMNTIYLQKFINPSELNINTHFDFTEECMTSVVTNCEIYMPLEGLIDLNAEIERLTSEYNKLIGEVQRGENMLANPNFINKAPIDKVNAEKQKLEDYKEKLQIVEARLTQLKG